MTPKKYNLPDSVSHKIIELDDAYKLIKDGDTITTSMAVCEPRGFYSQLHEASKNWTGVGVLGANPMQNYPCFQTPDLNKHINLRVMFLTPEVRAHQGRELIHYVPQHLSQWVRNMRLTDPPDIFWGSCSLPDKRGFISLGPGACYEPEVLRMAKQVILEINPKLPFTSGGTIFDTSDTDYFIFNEYKLPTIGSKQPSSTDLQIAEHINPLIADGSTIQLGIGGIPNAVALTLKNKKDLGVHTEMMNDAMADLYEQGVITSRRKTYFPNKIIATFALGSQRLYDFVNCNPVVEFYPASIVNDPYRMGRNYKMTSINTAVEIDITGQVCSESIGHKELSGVGGAMDTHIGAQRSAGGRGIIAIHSTGIDKNTKQKYSKIVLELHPGAKVSIGRNDIDTIVTEFGIAELRGKSVAERARSLIKIADPEFREELLFEAKHHSYI